MEICLKEYYPSMPDHFKIWCDDENHILDRVYYSNDSYIYASSHVLTSLWCKDMSGEEKVIWILRFGDFLPNTLSQLGFG